MLGAQVAVTTRTEEKRAALEALSADLVVNVERDDLVRRVRDWTGGLGADVVIDNVTGEGFPQVIEATRPHQGVIVAVGFLGGTQVSFDIRQFFFGQKQLWGSFAGDIDDLRWGLQQVKAGRITPSLDRVLPLSAAADAHRLVAGNQVAGNLVLLPWAA